MYTSQGILVCGRKDTTKTPLDKKQFLENFVEEKPNIKSSDLLDMSRYCEVNAIKDLKTGATNYVLKECPKVK